MYINHFATTRTLLRFSSFPYTNIHFLHYSRDVFGNFFLIPTSQLVYHVYLYISSPPYGAKRYWDLRSPHESTDKAQAPNTPPRHLDPYEQEPKGFVNSLNFQHWKSDSAWPPWSDYPDPLAEMKWHGMSLGQLSGQAHEHHAYTGTQCRLDSNA